MGCSRETTSAPQHRGLAEILLAAKILIDRNVQRAAVVSRRDNNAKWPMAEQLEAIAKRINKKYP